MPYKNAILCHSYVYFYSLNKIRDINSMKDLPERPEVLVDRIASFESFTKPAFLAGRPSLSIIVE